MPLAITPEAATSLAAAQIVNQINALAAQVHAAVTNGIPARGSQAAISASDLQAALGTANMAKITAVTAALA